MQIDSEIEALQYCLTGSSGFKFPGQLEAYLCSLHALSQSKGVLCVLTSDFKLATDMPLCVRLLPAPHSMEAEKHLRKLITK